MLNTTHITFFSKYKTHFYSSSLQLVLARTGELVILETPGQSGPRWAIASRISPHRRGKLELFLTITHIAIGNF